MKFKKLLLIIAAFAVMAACAVAAGAETYEDLGYSVLDDGTVAITWYNGSAEKVDIPEKIDGKSVTSIGDLAFYYCTSLKSITIPSDVTDIGDEAFSGCTSLSDITIPNGVTSINDGTFNECRSLTSITIPDSVTKIGSYAFYNCTSLESIAIPDGVTAIEARALNNTALLENQVTPEKYVGTWIVDCDNNSGSVTIKKGTTGIADSAFEDCTDITSIIIPDGVISIGEEAFYRCTSLADITIPDSVTGIKARAFEKCISLEDITIPNGVTYIGDFAFSGCIGLTEIKATAGNSKYVSVNGVLYNKDKTTIICYPVGKNEKTYKIIDGVANIGTAAFHGCKSLTSITIPSGVTEISKFAFNECTNLESVTIPDSVKNIGSAAFQSCKSFTSITIPDSVIGIDGYAFNNCVRLTSVTLSGSRAGTEGAASCNSGSLESIGESAFYNCRMLKTVTIPAGVKTIGDMAFGYYDDSAFFETKKVSGFNIYCYSGTDGEQYADENNFAYEILEMPTLAKVTGAKLGGRAADALRINWSKNASADGYIVEMYQGGKWERVAKITKNSTTTYRATGLKAGTVYNFRVKAYKMYGSTAIYSEYSATVAARTNPSVMTGVKLGGRAADALRINWSKNASADGYIVEMYQGGNWVRVAKITNNSTTTFRKAGLKAGTAYKFRVRAYKMSGSTALYGNYSATVAARTNPSVIKGAKLGGRAADALRINWSKNASADGYIVEMYQGGKWVRVGKITNNSTTTFRKAGLKASSVYKFRVRAYKMSGGTALYGNYSATVAARTNPSVVKGVKIAGKAKDALRVNWTKDASAQGYIVEMYKGGKWVRVAKITNSNTTTFRKAGLAKNTAYKFRVCAYYMSGKTALYGGYGSVSGKTAAK